MPAADEVYRLQTADEPECRFFRRAVRGKDDPSGGTMQGIYAFAAGGVCLGRLNSNNPDAVAAMLERALVRWAEIDEAQRRLPPNSALGAGHRWEASYPEGGLALVRTARDLPDSLDPSEEPRRPFNRDQVWFTAAEARQWLPDEIEVGAEHAVPDVLTHRLARFHLVDNVRGQTIPYAAQEVEASLRAVVESIEDGAACVRLTGETHSNALGPWLGGDNYWKPRREWPHSIRTLIHGEARYDLARGQFTSFDVVALGSRRGRTVMNGRGRDQDGDQRPIGFALSLAPAGHRVAPTFINVYNADWVQQPGR